MSKSLTVQKKIVDGRTDRHTDLSINYIGTRVSPVAKIHDAVR